MARHLVAEERREAETVEALPWADHLQADSILLGAAAQGQGGAVTLPDAVGDLQLSGTECQIQQVSLNTFHPSVSGTYAV